MTRTPGVCLAASVAWHALSVISVPGGVLVAGILYTLIITFYDSHMDSLSSVVSILIIVSTVVLSVTVIYLSLKLSHVTYGKHHSLSD
jgi:hypothetical protein